MNRAVLGGVAFAWLLLGVSAPARPDTPVDALCKIEKKPTDAEFFPEMAAAAIAMRRSVCVGGADTQGAVTAMIAFLESEARQERLRPYGFAADGNPLQLALDGIDVAAGKFPDMALAGNDALNVDGEPIAPAVPEDCQKAAELVRREATCRLALNEFAQIYTYAHSMVEKRGAIAFSKNVAVLTREWDDFFTNTRSQTLLELAFNSYLYRRSERPVFGSPPARQFIFLHPGLVLEMVDGAVEGDQTKETLMIEAFGVNWWRDRRWYLPSGASLVALYSDRASAHDVGYGLALHFKGVYTLGYSLRRGGEGGVFVSADLLKLFQSKKQLIGKYQP
jgi:hypothetical protein